MKKFNNLGKSDFKKIAISSNKTTRRIFKKLFKKEIDIFAQTIFDAYKFYKLTALKWKDNDKRNFWVEKYLQNAIDNLLCSVNHFISGFIVASGNLTRQFCESCAMAMLISNRKIAYNEKYFKELDKKCEDLYICLSSNVGNYYEIIKDIKGELYKIRINKSIKEVWDNKGNFHIDEKMWEEFSKIRNYYHKLSHPAPDALIGKLLAKSNSKGKIIFGARYDKVLKEGYEVRMNEKIDLAKILKKIMEIVNTQMIYD